jgi:hypothetical protein
LVQAIIDEAAHLDQMIALQVSTKQKPNGCSSASIAGAARYHATAESVLD